MLLTDLDTKNQSCVSVVSLYLHLTVTAQVLVGLKRQFRWEIKFTYKLLSYPSWNQGVDSSPCAMFYSASKG